MKSDFKLEWNGIVFKKGWLSLYSIEYSLEMTAWPRPMAWLKRNNYKKIASRFQANKVFSRSFREEVIMPMQAPLACSVSALNPHLLPSGQYVFSVILDESCNHVQSGKCPKGAGSDHIFFSAIPIEVRAELTRFHDRHWYLLNLFAKCPGAMDLSRSNAALFYALANHWIHRKWIGRGDPLEAAASMVCKKQKSILEWLGLPATETVRRILSKMELETFFMLHRPDFRDLLATQDVLKLLVHLERINYDVLEVVMNETYRSYVTPRFLTEIVRDRQLLEDQQSTAAVHLDVILALADRDGGYTVPAKFHSLQRLMEVYDDLFRKDRRRRWKERRASTLRCYGDRFPRPPFAGTEFICPIESPDDLAQEGIDMKHCVGFKLEEVFESREYVYQVLSPIRGTLSIRSSDDPGEWAPGELVMESNRLVDSALADELFYAVLHSPVCVDEAPYSAAKPEAPVSEALPDSRGMVIARCDLPEGQSPPYSWALDNPRQIPLLSPEELKIYMNVQKTFSSGT
jgi:hypothetical protein